MVDRDGAVPFFSIVTITKNNALGLERTLASVARQSFRDYEWIVVDGQSEDDTDALLATSRPEKTRIHKALDQGIYDAMNKGLDMARGRYMLFLNAGDVLCGIDTLASAHARMVVECADVWYGDCWMEWSPENRWYRRPVHCWLSYGMPTSHQAMFYRRSLVASTRYRLSYRVCADYAFTAEVHLRGATWAYLDLPVARCERGGWSDRNRRASYQEHCRVRHEILRLAWTKRTLIDLLQGIVELTKQVLPVLHHGLREVWRLRL